MGWLSKIFGKKTVSSGKKNIPNYPEIIKTLKIDDERIVELKLLEEKFKKTIYRYKQVSKDCLEFPIDLMFALHFRESSLNFGGVLHNGERILRTGKKTKLVPAGRGPFETWEEAAVDALMMKKSLFPKEWNLATKLEFAERFNGLGYRNTGEFSPYVFAGTNFHDETGKYVADGKYSSTAKEKQLGVASIMLQLQKIMENENVNKSSPS